MRAADVRRHGTTPLTAPAFPVGSHRFTDREYLNVVYRTDPDAFRAAVPEPLERDDPLVRFEVMHMGDVDGFGPYTECGQALQVSHDGEQGEYLHGMWLDNAPAIAAGREQSAYPEAFGSPALTIENGALVGTLRLGSLPVATATMVYEAEPLDLDLARTQVSAPTWMLKIVPGPDGPSLDRLVRTRITDLTVTGACASSPRPCPTAPPPTRSSPACAASPTSRPRSPGPTSCRSKGPENLDLKRSLFERIAAATPAGTLLLSSTSGLLPTDIARDLDDAGAARLVVAHPFNPPHLLPLVEVVVGERTSPATVDATRSFLAALGKDPVVLRREVSGFVANRLQSALFREAVSLVRDGVVTPDELDRVVTGSLGPRWATGGPFLSFHLGGGPGGLRHMLTHLGPGMARRWQSPGTPTLDEDTVDALSAASESAYGDRSYAALTAERDRAQIAVLAARGTPDTEESS